MSELLQLLFTYCKSNRGQIASGARQMGDEAICYFSRENCSFALKNELFARKTDEQIPNPASTVITTDENAIMPTRKLQLGALEPSANFLKLLFLELCQSILTILLYYGGCRGGEGYFKMQLSIVRCQCPFKNNKYKCIASWALKLARL